VLHARLQRLLDESIEPDETVLFVVEGKGNQALAALDRRLLVLKAGAAAGLPFQARARSFAYAAITGIDVERGSALSVVWFTSADFRTQEKEWWQSRDSARDPFRAPNAFPVATDELETLEPCLARLRAAIAEAGEEPIVDSLERLAALHASGALTTEEFERAKERLLGAA
jgi:hypothetical protein